MGIRERYTKDISLVENYELAKADNFKGWQIHHRLETYDSDGNKRLVDLTHKELKALDMYYHRPASELIFMTVKDHCHIHRHGKPGRRLSEETKRKIGNANRGLKRSDEEKAAISQKLKGRKMPPEFGKRLSEALKGRQFTDEWRAKISKNRKGKTGGNGGNGHAHWKLVDGKRKYYD